MEYFRRQDVPTRLIALVLCVSWIGLLCAADRPRSEIRRGEPTADGAARSERTNSSARSQMLSGWEPSAEFIAAAALSDTTEVEFPEEKEEKTTKQLVKDISVFIIVSAFVGYFIVKVFLEGDEETLPPDDDGKIIPTSSRSLRHGP